jgi:hypothetical protein
MKVFFSLIILIAAAGANAIDCQLPNPWVATRTMQFGYEEHRSAMRRVLGVGVECSDLLPMTELYQAMLDFIPKAWPLPDRLLLNITPEASNAYVNGNRVNLPLIFLDIDKNKIAPKKIIAVWAHEFAHVFLNTLIENKIPDIREFNDLYFEQLGVKEIRAIALEDIPYFQVLGPSKLNDYFEAQKAYRDANDELMRIDKAIAKLPESRFIKNVNRVSKPYHEFFADLVTVIYLNNLSAVAESLKTDYSAVKDTELAKRDFAYAGNALETWEGNLDELTDSHHTMAASRYEVGKILKTKNQSEKLLLLDKISDLIIEEINRQANLDEIEDPITLNRTFIEKIHKLK